MLPKKYQRGIPPMQKERKHKINGEVRFPLVRLIGGEEAPQVISSYEASKIAESMGLDLILISETQEIPIVKIGDYNKFLYEIEKAEKERKKNTHKTEIKEIKLSCEIHENDLLTKSRKGKEFLEDNDKIKIVIQLKGRQRTMPERGEFVMYRFADMLKDFGIPEDNPKLEGGKWIMTIRPLKK
jgi:translation initiation factor IF-3